LRNSTRRRRSALYGVIINSMGVAVNRLAEVWPACSTGCGCPVASEQQTVSDICGTYAVCELVDRSGVQICDVLQRDVFRPPVIFRMSIGD
jgi:hypothetical protein